MNDDDKLAEYTRVYDLLHKKDNQVGIALRCDIKLVSDGFCVYHRP